MLRSTYLTVLALLYALLVGVQVTSVAARPLPSVNTNAGRIARGLSPFRPRFDRTIPGRGLTPTRVVEAGPHDADHVRREQYPSESATPPSKLRGAITVVHATSGHDVGYVSNEFFSGDQRRFEVTRDLDHVMKVSFLEGSNPFDIEILNGPAAWPFLGWTTTSGSGSVTNVDSSPSLELVGTNEGNATTPSKVGNSFNSGASESKIWSYNSDKKRLTIQWINPDNAPAVTKFWYSPNDRAIRAVRSGFGGPGYEAYLAFDDSV